LTKPTIKFLYDYIDGALWRMTIYYNMNMLNEMGYPSACCNLLGQNPGEADVYVFYRCVTTPALEMMQRLKRHRFVVYGIDDYLFQPNCRFHWKIKADDYEAFFKMANAVMASSQRLLDHVPVENKFLYRTTIDRESLGLLSKRTKQLGQPFTIGWLAGNAHGMDEFVSRILSELNARLTAGERCVFHRFGKHLPVSQYAHVEVVDNPYIEVNEWRDRYRKFSSLGLDLSIYPLPEDEEFFHCKSELKFVEAGAMGIPLLASRMSQFKEFIREGENGFFASTPEEFADKIVLLIRNPQKATMVGLAAKEFVERECLSEVRTKQLLERLSNVREDIKATTH
jgi:glycosyltransferase involved in cell wall biosynthesis